MATMKQVYKEVDEMVKTIGLSKTKDKVSENVMYTKNSVTKVFWTHILESYLPKLEKQ